jgi:chorismate mutase/prephenate dehydratase
VPSEPTGRDHTYLVVETVDQIGLERLSTVLKQVDINPVFMSVWRDPDSSSRYMHLAEVEGFITDDDRIILRLGECLGGAASSIRTIGTYGQPLTLEEPEIK